MCLINFHFQDHPNYKLIIAANRDEAYDRPTAPAHFWEDEPEILAGRDLQQFGTWLGITKQGHFAALTNVRSPGQIGTRKTSRGEIVTNYLTANLSPEDFLKSLEKNKDNYVGFNVIVGNPKQLFHYSNIQDRITEITTGTHGLSNASLNTPWPKITKGKKLLRDYVMGVDKIAPDKLFEIISDAEMAPDRSLPDTGVGLDLERKLSPLFIKTPTYGTRSSTVLLVDKDNYTTFRERTYEKGEFLKEKRFEFRIDN